MKHNKVRMRWKRQSGFTLLEILLVVVIIGFLVGFLIMNLSGVKDDAAIRTTQGIVKGTLSTALDTYNLQSQNYPPNLDALLNRPANAPPNWHKLVKELRSDPWNEPYQYRQPGVHNSESYDVWSKGPDRTDGTADDIGNWPPPLAQQNF